MRSNYFVSSRGEEAVVIKLDCSPSSSLAWDFSVFDRLASSGKKITLSLFFDLSLEETNFHNQSLFAARLFALEYLYKNVLLPYEPHILSLSFYEGPFDFTPSLRKFSNLSSLYSDYLQDIDFQDTPHLRRLFSLELLMVYLHRLSASIPSEIFSFVLLEMPKKARKSEMAEFLSKEYFPYIYPGASNAPSLFEGVGWKNNLGLHGYFGLPDSFSKKEEPQVGVALPIKGSIDYSLVDELLQKLEEEGIPFRIFPETLLVESWGGLEKIYIFPETLGLETKRHLQGFIAAEGVVEEFRGRGIRTPDLLVPNQTR